MYSEPDNANCAGTMTNTISAISQKVFLVHGHDVGVLNSVTRFLREQLELEVVIFHERPNKSRTIIEKLEANSDNVGFVVILLTPDDVGASRKSRKDLKKRARQNVILELGYFIGKLGRDSDLDGVLHIPYDIFGEWRSKLADEMQEAGIEVGLTKFQKAENRANEDEQTGLLNHGFFNETLSAECNRSKGAKEIFSVILLDLDNFKAINDTYGHAQGDKLIKRVGLVLDQTCSRDQTVSRYGGDEFAILASGLGTQQAYQLADRLRSALVTDVVLKRRKVTGSFGVASYPWHGKTPQKIVEAADEQMYVSK